MHPVFHVSQLRQVLKSGMSATPFLPQQTDLVAIPFKILARGWRKKANKMVEQVLMHWSSSTASAATWEDYEELRSRFPAAPAWGQAGSQEGRDVRDPSESGVEEKNSLPAASCTAEEPTSGDNGPTRPRRSPKPNSRYIGPTWSK